MSGDCKPALNLFPVAQVEIPPTEPQSWRWPDQSASFDPRRYVRVLGPGLTMRGMVSAVHPSLLGEGEFALVENFRIAGRGLTARMGTESAINANALPSGVILGGIDTDDWSFRAVVDGGATKIYYRNGSAWQEVTAATGAYGNTRFSSTTAQVSFAVVRDPMMPDMLQFSDPKDTYLIACNGIESPRVFQLRSETLSAADVGIAQKIDPPKLIDVTCKPVFSAYFNLVGASSFTASDIAKITSSVVTGTYGKYLSAEFLTTITDGTTAEATFSSISLANDPTQFHMVFQCQDVSIWSKLKVSLITSTGDEYVIHDPTNNTSLPVVGVAPSDDAGYYQVGISLSRAWLSGTETALPITSYNKVKFTWVGDAWTYTPKLQIYAIGFGGEIQYGAQLAATYFCGEPDSTSSPYREGAGSRSESSISPCLLLRSPTLSEVGGTPIPNVHLAEQAGFFYRYRIVYPNPPAISETKPITHVLIYGKFVGQPNYTLAVYDPPRVGDYSTGSWAYVSGAANTLLTTTINSERVTPRKAPTAFSQPIPIGTTLFTNGARLFVGNARFSSNDRGLGQVAISADGNPFRFANKATTNAQGVVADSATIAQCPGEEVMGLEAASGAPLGADAVYIVTQRNVYSVDNSDALNLSVLRWLGPHGTLSPRSIVKYKGLVCWLDQYRQVVQLTDSGLDILSRDRVDDQLSGIPASRLANVVSCAFNDRLYLTYTPAGETTNIKTLVWDFYHQAWTRDAKPHDIVGYSIVKRSNEERLWSFNADGTTVRHESPTATTDSGTAITQALHGNEFTGDPESDIAIGQMLVRTSAQSISLTTTRTKASSGDTVTGTITLGAVSASWERDYDSGKHPSASDIAVRWKLSGNLGPGKQLFAVELEVARVSGGA